MAKVVIECSGTDALVARGDIRRAKDDALVVRDIEMSKGDEPVFDLEPGHMYVYVFNFSLDQGKLKFVAKLGNEKLAEKERDAKHGQRLRRFAFEVKS